MSTEVITPESTSGDIGDPKMAMRFLMAAFPKESKCSIRPTECWTDEVTGQRRTLVDYDWTRQVTVNRLAEALIRLVLKRSVEKSTNTFFGVCPRFGTGNRFERAWQIRTVSMLWADIDNAKSLEEVLERLKAAGLPHPSAIVSSGRGFHLYWFLDTPYLIDDVGDPPRIEYEWVEIKGKKKKLEYFKDANGDRHNLHDPKTGNPSNQNSPALSDKAIYAQDIVAGIATSIGADHTFDLVRLLRLPGSWNLKEKRNGAEPKMCVLLEMTEERFSIDRFSEFALKSPDKKKREIIKSVPLPSVRKMTAGRRDKLADRILACQISEDRSKADFSLCSFSIEQGIDPEEVWLQVADIGKFAERGRSYFDITWDKAADSTRRKHFEKIEQEGSTSSKSIPIVITDAELGIDAEIVPSRRMILHSPESDTVSSLFTKITDTLIDSNEVYNRAGNTVQIRGANIIAINDQPTLAATLVSYREMMIQESKGEDGTSSEYVVLPPKYANPWLRDSRQIERLPPITLYTRAPVYLQTSTGWRVSAPGYDKETGVYYAGPEITPSDSTHHIDVLLADVCWKSPADRTNYIAMLLTIVLISRFISSKPGLLMLGNQQGTGKSKLAQCISILRCGHVAPTITYNERDEEMEKRLGSIVRSGIETIIVDNAKTKRGTEINSQVIDRLITDPIVSFRLLGTSTDIRAENSFIFALTANTTEVCRDLITRTVPVNLEYLGDATIRQFDIDLEAYTEEHRSEIIAELLGMVKRWIDSGCPLSSVRTRFESKKWGATIGGILQVSGDEDFMSNVGQVARDLDPVRLEFTSLVEGMTGMSLETKWKVSEMLTVAVKEKLFEDDLAHKPHHGQVTRLGMILSRFVNVEFTIEGMGSLIFKSGTDRNGTFYYLKRPENAVPAEPSLFEVPQRK